MAVATDYDGTIAKDGRVPPDTITAIKDQLVAEAVRKIEQESSLSAHDSRQRIAHAIEERYTLPATGL